MLRVALLAIAALTIALPAHAAEHSPVGTWSTIIPRGFEGAVFTWRIKANDTYTEDGRLIATGEAIQETLSGKWKIKGKRLTLTQDTIGYVFKGVVADDTYSGTLYLNGDPVSQFCSVRGETPPKTCGDAPSV